MICSNACLKWRSQGEHCVNNVLPVTFTFNSVNNEYRACLDFVGDSSTHWATCRPKIFPGGDPDLNWRPLNLQPNALPLSYTHVCWNIRRNICVLIKDWYCPWANLHCFLKPLPKMEIACMLYLLLLFPAKPQHLFVCDIRVRVGGTSTSALTPANEAFRALCPNHIFCVSQLSHHLTTRGNGQECDMAAKVSLASVW